MFSSGKVSQFDKENPTPAMEWIDYGIGGLDASVLSMVDIHEPDLAVLHHTLAQRGLLFGFEAVHRFYEIGTPEALHETERFLYRMRRNNTAAT
jgi:NDP-sugar pyrophosphorylase family protein